MFADCSALLARVRAAPRPPPPPPTRASRSCRSSCTARLDPRLPAARHRRHARGASRADRSSQVVRVASGRGDDRRRRPRRRSTGPARGRRLRRVRVLHAVRRRRQPRPALRCRHGNEATRPRAPSSCRRRDRRDHPEARRRSPTVGRYTLASRPRRRRVSARPQRARRCRRAPPTPSRSFSLDGCAARREAFEQAIRQQGCRARSAGRTAGGSRREPLSPRPAERAGAV